MVWKLNIKINSRSFKIFFQLIKGHFLRAISTGKFNSILHLNSISELEEGEYKLALYSFIYSEEKRYEEDNDSILIKFNEKNTSITSFKIQRTNDIQWILDEFYFTLNSSEKVDNVYLVMIFNITYIMFFFLKKIKVEFVGASNAVLMAIDEISIFKLERNF